MDGSLDLCLSCGAVVFNDSPYCSLECHALDAAPSSSFFPRASSSQHSIDPSSSRTNSTKWPGNDRAGIQNWAKGVWRTTISPDDTASIATSKKSSIRRRTPVSSSPPALISAQQLAAPALSGLARSGSASSASSSESDLASLLTPSSTPSASIPIPSKSQSQLRSWFTPVTKPSPAHPQDVDPWISSPPYYDAKHSAVPQRGRPLIRAEW